MRTRLFRTSSFQIAILYLVLLSATLVVLLGFVYWSTAGLIERQMSDTIEAEIRGLAEQYRTEGLGRLVAVVRERSGPNGDPQNVYLLTDPTLRPLAGNLAAWPRRPAGDAGWIEIELERSGDAPDRIHVVRGRAFDLTGDFHLFVGRDTVARGDFQRIVGRALAWALIPALVLGLIGGALIGRYSLRRVDAVRSAGAAIVNGDLSRRVPLTGSRDEFDRLAETINDMLERIETLMGGMRLVTDSLAHDLRSPLTHARSNIDEALRGAPDADAYRNALEQTGEELEGTLRTFDALINIARAEAGVGKLTLERLDLSALARDLFDLYQPIAEDAGLAFESEIEDGIALVGHRQLLGQAISNLLDNAAKYTPPGGRIAVSIRARDGRTELRVHDSGPGIPEMERRRVLDRFVRLDRSRGTPGSGLGLSLVAAVAKLHGAGLTLADAGPGLVVTLDFPAE